MAGGIDDRLATALCFDVETQGSRREYALQPWRLRQRHARLSTVATTWNEGDSVGTDGAVMPISRDWLVKNVLQRAIDEDRWIVGWNVQFDVSWLLAYGLHDLVFRVKWIDSMRLWRHLDLEPEYEATNASQRRSYGLKNAVREFLPHMANYEAGIDYQATDPESLERLLHYNKLDTVATLILAERFWRQLNDQQKACARLEADMIPWVADANLRGMHVDHQALNAVDAAMSQQILDARSLLEPLGVTEATIGSPAQMAKVLFEDWGLTPIKFNSARILKDGTLATSPSTDKEVLHELGLTDPRAKALRKWREGLNLKSKFIGALTASTAYNGDGRTHPEARLAGTYSGRLTYSSMQRREGRKVADIPTGFALHQMKSSGQFRKMIIPPAGYDLLEFDAASQEFKWMAILSKDPAMLKLCMPGEDAHSYMAARIDPDPTHDYAWVKANKEGAGKGIRKLGKVANLSLQYRTRPPKLRTVARVQYDIPLELPEAQHITKVYLQTYEQVPVYWDLQIARGKRLGYVETIAGRRVQIKGAWDRSNANLWSMQSTAINFPIQGTGADQKYLAVSCLHDYCVSHGIYLAWDLHDGLYFYCPKDKSERAAYEMRDILNNLPYDKAWGFTPPVPLTFDAKIGTSWGDLKEIA